jgi:hypothetical protein
MGTLTEVQVVQDVISNEQRSDFHVPSFALSLLLLLCVVGALGVSFAVLGVQLSQERGA